MQVALLGQACGAERGAGDECFGDLQQVGGDGLRHPAIVSDVRPWPCRRPGSGGVLDADREPPPRIAGASRVY
ncbi:hypothetical protein GCM10022248_54920 [Nonomuraea soli]